MNAERVDRWANLRYLAGTWKMEKPDVTNTQQYSFMFNGTFLQMKTKAVFKPGEKTPNGKIHEDSGVFSYDGFRNKLILRSFHSEGFVNTYVLDGISEDGKILTFITESVENAPAGTRAKLTFEKISEKEFVQKFYVAWPDKDYNCYSDNLFKKVK
jgi:hypothetical protein